MTKVLLVQPTEYREFYGLDRDYSRYLSRELGLLQIGSMLEDNNLEVKLIPGLYSREKTFSLVEKYSKESDVIGTTCLTPEINIALDILGKSKKANPNIKTVIGGQHATWMDKETIKNKNVDIVVRGEGEHSFLDVVKGRKLDGINGITFRKGRMIQKNKNHDVLKEIPKLNEDLLKRYLDDIDKEVFSGPYERFQFNHMVTRGCPYNCTYCSNHALKKNLTGKYVRFRSVDSVIEEIRLRINQKQKFE